MASMPPARKRTLNTPVALPGQAMPPIPASYIVAFVAMLVGVVALHEFAGATLIEAVAVIDALIAVLIVLIWRQER